MSDLTSLLERVENATGLSSAESLRLDLEIFDALNPAGAVRNYTASIDAALALVAEKLPGCNGCLMFGEPYRNPMAKLSPLSDDGRVPHESGGATLQLAILSALLRALVAQAGTQEGGEDV